MTKHKPLPSQERLQELFDYSIVTGELRWKTTTSNRVKSGDIAGTLHRDTYILVMVDGTAFRAHRLIWCLITGIDPADNQIDHKDLNGTNNAWRNLRECSDAQNQCNKSKRADCRAPYKGVRKMGLSYQSRIKLGGKSYHLGTFPTPEEAHAAYCKAAAELHGDFARTH